jgi:holliday junction DNA helicase RuvA
MIARLKGIIECIKPNEAVIDVHGVGYSVSIPLSTYSAIVSLKEASLFIHTYVREDQIRLFGFFSLKEKQLFETVIGISGIGPSIALSILSGIDPDRLFESVSSDDISYLLKVPGIGKSKAEKLLFELKRILRKKGIAASEHSLPRVHLETAEALVALGFDEKKALDAAERAVKKNPDASLEAVIKEALGIMSEYKGQ